MRTKKVGKKIVYLPPTDEEIEESLWNQTLAEDDPRYPLLVKASIEHHQWRKEYTRWWEERYPDSMVKYYTYCMKYHIWRHESKWHSDSPWYGEENGKFKKSKI
jgi:hypothetical protein